MTESESVALPFGDSPMCCFVSQHNVLYGSGGEKSRVNFNFLKKNFVRGFYRVFLIFLQVFADFFRGGGIIGKTL